MLEVNLLARKKARFRLQKKKIVITIFILLMTFIYCYSKPSKPLPVKISPQIVIKKPTTIPTTISNQPRINLLNKLNSQQLALYQKLGSLVNNKKYFLILKQNHQLYLMSL